MSWAERMTDQSDAARLDASRTTIRSAGAGALDPRPWQAPGQPASDGDLVRFAAWAARDPDVDPAVLAAGLHLLASARADLDQVEAALLYAARAGGMTWAQVADAMSLRSAQAAQQRLGRLLARVDEGP